LRIPNNYSEVIRAINAGMPISSANKSDFAAAIKKWAHEVVSTNKQEKAKAAAAVQSKVGVLRLFGRVS